MHGFALGAGFELALACDLRIVAEETMLGLPEAELGMMPDMGGCERLALLAGYATAVELSLSCRRIDATEALAFAYELTAGQLQDRRSSVLVGGRGDVGSGP